MNIVCSDLEGVFVPEIWINVAIKTGIEELKLTTRDISDYDVLMKKRLSILKENNLRLQDIQSVIANVDPLEGAVEFLDWLRARTQVIIVSDTFVQFAKPLMEKLGRPALFCHSLSVAGDGAITGYNLRQQNGKYQTVLALRNLNYSIAGIGDSYNDINMLKAADTGILFNPPQIVRDEFLELPAVYNYNDLKELLKNIHD